MILFKELVIAYGNATVLDNINLEIEGGEWIWLTGPSGAGKSTLVHALMGAVRVKSGSVTVDDYVVNRFKATALQEYRRHIGVVFQDYKLLAKKTVYENIAFAMEVCGYSSSQIRSKVHEILEKVGLAGKAQHFPHMLSGGERQRVAIARALIHEPRLIIADEPTGNLDPDTARDIVDLFYKLNIEGATVIFATHNPHLLKQIKGREVRIVDGKLAKT